MTEPGDSPLWLRKGHGPVMRVCKRISPTMTGLWFMASHLARKPAAGPRVDPGREAHDAEEAAEAVI